MRVMTAEAARREPFNCEDWQARPANASKLEVQAGDFLHDIYEAGYQGDFGVARARLLKYNIFAKDRMFSYVCTADGFVSEGATIVQRVAFGFFAIETAVRVVEVVETENSASFSYATLAGHPERGIASFEVTREGELVTFRAQAWSRPGNLISRISRPISRRLQRFITNEAVAAFVNQPQWNVGPGKARVRRLKVMWDYSAFPVWQAGGLGEMAEEIPISDALRSSLMDWSDEWTGVMTGSDELGSRRPSTAVKRDWIERGRQLSRRLQTELGNDYEVLYFNEETGALE